MPIINFEYQEGTIKQPQQTESTQRAFVETNNVHFPDGMLRPIPASSIAVGESGSAAIRGVCRSIWGTRLGTLNFQGSHYLFGTDVGLFAEYRGVRYNVTPLRQVAVPLATDALSATIGQSVVTVSYVAHGLAAGDRIKISGAADFGGILSNSLNKEHIIASVIDDDSFAVDVFQLATATASGGGAAMQINTPIADGNSEQSAFSGYGASTYGAGAYGINKFSTNNFSFPRIWSFDNFGNDLVMCPGDANAGDGQKIYIWDGETVKTAYQTVINSEARRFMTAGINDRQAIAMAERQVMAWAAQQSDPTLAVVKHGLALMDVLGVQVKPLQNKQQPATIDMKNRAESKKRAGRPNVQSSASSQKPIMKGSDYMMTHWS